MSPLRFHPDVQQELRDAYLWFESNAEGLGEDLLQELDQSYLVIQQIPMTWPAVAPGIRRYLLKRFPYGVLYKVDDQGIQVVAIMHLSRRPGYWQKRVQ